MNTTKYGQVSLVIFKTPKSKEYVGFCYEFGIVLQNKSVEVLQKELFDSVKGYVETVRENSLSEDLLNKQHMLPDEYKLLHRVLEKRIAKKRVREELPKEYEQAVDTGW